MSGRLSAGASRQLPVGTVRCLCIARGACAFRGWCGLLRRRGSDRAIAAGNEFSTGFIAGGDFFCRFRHAIVGAQGFARQGFEFLQAGQFVQSLRPKRIRNSFDVR